MRTVIDICRMPLGTDAAEDVEPADCGNAVARAWRPLFRAIVGRRRHLPNGGDCASVYVVSSDTCDGGPATRPMPIRPGCSTGCSIITRAGCVWLARRCSFSTVRPAAGGAGRCDQGEAAAEVVAVCPVLPADPASWFDLDRDAAEIADKDCLRKMEGEIARLSREISRHRGLS